MVAFGHTAVGALIGIASFQAFSQGDIALGLIGTGFLGVISHYLTDLIPHGHFFNDPKKYEELVIWVILFDVLMPVLFILGLAHFLGKPGSEILYILFGIGGAQMPDVLYGLNELRLLPEIKIFKMEGNFHQSTHWHGKKEKALLLNYTDLWQVTLFALALVALILP